MSTTILGASAQYVPITSASLVLPAALFISPTAGVFASNVLTFTPTLATQAAHTVVAGPLSGPDATPTCRRFYISELLPASGVGNPVSWIYKSTLDPVYTAVHGDKILVNTTAGAVTINLPASPSLGDCVEVVDTLGTFALANKYLTLGGNGSKINGSLFDLNLNTAGQRAICVYTALSNWGWTVR